MNRTRAGFTLMEIMVVIIVIAVLASVAGPMIGSITDQGRASATKSKLSSLKSALISYNNDVGRFPYIGASTNVSASAAYNGTNASFMSDDATQNVLVTNDAMPFSTNYQRRWKGPYMDSDPKDFMYDGWGNKIDYFATGKNLYLRSSGINGTPETLVDALNSALQESGDVDDIIMSVAKFRKTFN